VLVSVARYGRIVVVGDTEQEALAVAIEARLFALLHEERGQRVFLSHSVPL
jgi:hypothetical protein